MTTKEKAWKKYQNGKKIDNTTQLIFEDAWIKYLKSESRKKYTFDEWLIFSKEGQKYFNRFANISESEFNLNEPIMSANGMKLQGPSHDEGGISGINKDTNQPIEVEGGEVIINKRSMKIREHITCTGTPEGIASEINMLGDGDKLSDQPGECHLKNEIMERGAKIKKIKMGDYVEFQPKKGTYYYGKVLDVNEDTNEAKIEYEFSNEDIKSWISIQKLEKMENGKKIQSYLNPNLEIEKQIEQENKLKTESMAENGMKLTADDKLIRINQEQDFFILCFLQNVNFSVWSVFKHNDICVYKAENRLISFLDKYKIHYTAFDNQEEFSNWLTNLLSKETIEIINNNN